MLRGERQCGYTESVEMGRAGTELFRLGVEKRFWGKLLDLLRISCRV